jgi:hypothetical protein
MARSLINLNLFKLSYSDLADFAQKIHDGFVAQVADYPTPNPLMLPFQNDIKALSTCITNWGIEGNRGSHADHLALIDARTVVRNDLRMLAAYAQNTKPDNAASWTALGFNIKKPKSAPVALQVVQNFRQFQSREIPAGKIKLKWKRPLNTQAADVKGYIVQFNNVAVQPLIDGSRAIANVIGIVADTTILLEPQYVGANYFWVTPFNSVGYGVSSDSVFFNAPAKP